MKIIIQILTSLPCLIINAIDRVKCTVSIPFIVHFKYYNVTIIYHKVHLYVISFLHLNVSINCLVTDILSYFVFIRKKKTSYRFETT